MKSGNLVSGLAANPVIGAALALATAGGLVWFFWGRKIADAAQRVNPASDQNIIYAGISEIGEVITGDEGFSLGSWLYDITHIEPGETTPDDETTNNDNSIFEGDFGA